MVDVFAVGIEHRADMVADPLVARLDVGAAGGAVALDIDQDAADQVLRAAALVEEAGHVVAQFSHAVLLHPGAVIEAEVVGEDIA